MKDFQIDKKSLAILSVAVILIDLVFISLMSGMFTLQIEKVQNKPLEVNMYSAVLCYILIISGLYYYIIHCNRPVKDAFLLGIFVYGVYELTTMSLLRDWVWSTVIIDTIWGGTLFALSTYITYRLR